MRDELLADLIDRTKQVIRELEQFSSLSGEEFNYRVSDRSWSILECIEHLSLYGDFYIPEIRNRIANAQPSNNNEFKSGWLGNYFAISMLPGEKGKLNKMKTFKEMNPINKALNASVLDRFRKQQLEMLELLMAASGVDLGKTKTSISISKWIKLKLGDTFRVVVYHNQRHMAQALRVQKELLAVAN
ncbi:MAG: DinB family protein [Cyclobacteriaceae bacterium]